MTIRAGIVGYGNLGRSAEKLVKLQPDMELVGIFSHRPGHGNARAPGGVGRRARRAVRQRLAD